MYPLDALPLIAGERPFLTFPIDADLCNTGEGRFLLALYFADGRLAFVETKDVYSG
jgi:hypothetical protein